MFGIRIWLKSILKIKCWKEIFIGIGIIITISFVFYFLYIKWCVVGNVILSLVDKFGTSIAKALFWILIIFSIAGALIWVFRSGINYFFFEEVQGKLPKPPKEEE